MAPTPKFDVKDLQPFKVVEDNWDTIKPHYDHIMATVTFGSVIMAFVSTLSMIIKHGFKVPRLHPIVGIDELEPSWSHPNDYVSDQDLTDAKLYEFAMEQRRNFLWNDAYVRERKKRQEKNRIDQVEVDSAQ